MKLYSLSDDLTKPCVVINLNGVHIMLDCGLSERSVLNYMPFSPGNYQRLYGQYDGEFDEQAERFKGVLKECCNGSVLVNETPQFEVPRDTIIDFQLIDVILISNYANMLALPFITEDTNFKGKIYATEPTMQIGRFLMEELASELKNDQKAIFGDMWKQLLNELPPPLSEAKRAHKWRQIFTLKSVQNSLSKVKVAGFEEKVNIFGVLTAKAISSGYCAGSSNWIISTEFNKFCYMSSSSIERTHAAAIMTKDMHNADVMLLSGVKEAIDSNENLSKLKTIVVDTLRNEGTVLIPCTSFVFCFDIIEAISESLLAADILTPKYFVSSIASQLLGFANVYAEWLNLLKQRQVFLKNKCFDFGRMICLKSGCCENIDQVFDKSCIIFCSHPSLRFGKVVELLSILDNDTRNAICLIDPNFPITDVLRPFVPLNMQVHNLPIDWALNFEQANEFVQHFQPKILLLPQTYASHMSIEKKTQVITFENVDILKVPFKLEKVRCFMKEELNKTLKLQKIDEEKDDFFDEKHIYATTFTAQLYTKDGEHLLEPLSQIMSDSLVPSLSSSSSAVAAAKVVLPAAPNKVSLLAKRKYQYGNINVTTLMDYLTNAGFKCCKLSCNSIFIEEHNLKIDLEHNFTNITAVGTCDAAVRQKLWHIISNQLSHF